jgi:hypothetical protein
VVIRTPDRRLRVFVSSTIGEHGELAEERRAVVFELGARGPPRLRPHQGQRGRGGGELPAP